MDRIEELTRGCFNAVLALRKLDPSSSANPEEMQRRVRREIDNLLQGAAQKGVSHEDAREMAYAIVALADETALKGPPALSKFWMNNLLQMRYFNENAAGESFFQHLENLRSAHRYDVLRIYYLCLTLGYMGRYSMRGGELELDDLINGLLQTLSRAGVADADTLSPNAERPREAAIASQKRRLNWLWLPVGALGAAVVLYIALAATMAGHASDVAEYIEKLTH